MAECPYCEGKFETPDITANLDSNCVEIDGRRVAVARPGSCELLSILLATYPMSASNEMIASGLWGASVGPDNIQRTITTYACVLRKAFVGTDWTVRCNRRGKYQLVRKRGAINGCPYCGGAYSPPPLRADLDRYFIEVGRHRVKVEPKVCEIFAALVANQTAILSDERLATRLWGSHGRPSNVRGYIAIYIWRLRKALTGTGWAVKNSFGDGYQLVAA